MKNNKSTEGAIGSTSVSLVDIFRAILLAITIFCLIIALGVLFHMIKDGHYDIYYSSDASINWVSLTISIIVAIIISVTLFFPQIFSKKTRKIRQKEYLENNYEKCQKKMIGVGKKLQLLRTVPEIKESLSTENEYLDEITKYKKELEEIEEAKKELGLG